MASKQVSEILLKLGIQGLQGLDKLKSSFRELEKSLGPSAATIERARESIIAFGREGRNTEQVIKGQVEALRGLQSQTERGSTAWAVLAGDIERFRQASRRTDQEISILRESILSVATGSNQSQQSLRSYIADLGRLRNEATITGSVFSALGNDISELTARLKQAETQTTQTGRSFGRVLGQALASTSAGAKQQIQDLGELINEQRDLIDSIDARSARERRLKKYIEERAEAEDRLNRALAQRRQATYQESARTGRETVRSAATAFADPDFLRTISPEALDKRLGELPNTTAGFSQGLSELSERLANTTRNTTDYLVVAMQMAGMQRELTAVTQGYAQALLMGIRTGTVAPSARNLQEVITALRAEMSQLDVTTSEGARAYAENASQARALEQQLKGLANAYRHVGDMAAEAAAAQTSEATARVTANYLNRSLVRQQEAAMAELSQRVRAGVAATPLALPAAGSTTAAGTGQLISGGARRLTGPIETTFDTPGRRMARTIGERSGYYNPPTAATGAAAAVGQSAEAINRTNKSYSNLLVNLREVLLASDKSISSLEQQRSAWTALRQAVDPASKQFANSTKQIEALDARLEKLQATRRRLTAGQAVQSAGAIISGGIFGGPEGFVGGLGGFAAGLAIPGLGPVGGAFAGAAAGAQLGGLRQAAGAAAEYAAEIRRLQLALQGVVYSFEDYRSALGAIESASQQFNIPILQSTQQFTKLTAAVVGSGGTIKDAENTFKGLSASVLATGGSIQDVNGALVAAAQVFSKGKVSAEELRGQIGERLAGAFALFAESSGKSTKELDADLQAGEVTLAQFVQFVEFSLKKYGRTAQIIADSPEQAGARLDLALKNLQKNIGNALGPSGAAFQDFAARSIRGIDRVINKLIELRAIQPGAGFYQEQVLGKRMSIKELETALLEAGSRETALRKSVVPGLGFMADLLPEIAEATKKVKILEEALVKLRLIEKETNKERKQRQDDEAKADREKLGQQYLQAVEQREESLLDARRQREEQIAQIRKNAIEEAAQIERQLADERRNIERDMERVRREMQAGSGEIDRLRRLAQGEDPRVIEAERAAAQISQQATEDRIKAEEDLLDKELQQQRTIADFQKNTAKQIADANENYAKRVGEIQRDFAKASAKIIEEGSGRAAKRITLAAQIVSQVLQRTSLNQQRTQFGLQPIGEPIGRDRRGQFIYYKSEPGKPDIEIPPQIRRIDENLEQLLKKLSARQGNQGSLPSFRMSSRASGIGEQFLGLLGAERGYEDVAGLQPLPLQKMLQQIGRPLTVLYNKIERARQSVYPYSRREINEMLSPDPARTQTILQRAQAVERARQSDPLEAQWRERENRWRTNKRSAPAAASLSAFKGVAQVVAGDAFKKLNQMGGMYGIIDDLSDYLTETQLDVLRKGVREQLKQGVKPYQMPTGGNPRTGRASVEKAIRAITGDILEEIRLEGTRDIDGIDIDRIMRLNEPPRIQPGIESKFEGAMLPGSSFNISRLAKNFGNIASASGASPLQYFPAIAQSIRGAAPTTQMREQATQQRFEQIDQQALIKAYEVLSQVKSSSAQTLENFQLQNREIELQIQNLSDGMEPELAGQLSGLQANYEIQQQQLEIQRQALINAGLNEEAVNRAYAAESAALARIYEQNQAAIAQYREKQKVLELIQNTSSILESNLTSAISNSIQVLVTGSGTVRQVLADMFQSIGQAFIQMAAQIIAKQLVMITLGSIMKALGLTAGSSSGKFSGGYFDPATGLGAAGPNFGLAKGGYFADGMANLPANSIIPFANGGIVSKPTFFKFANGGAMSAGVMGEAGPEAIMPLKRGADGKLGVAAKLDGAMSRYRRPPGTPGGVAGGGIDGESSGGAASQNATIDVRYTVERINSVDYVTADQFRAGMQQAAAQGAQRGEQATIRRLKQSQSTRSRLGI